MNLDPKSCYAALLARDARFDGVFFTGVKTTGIYCRPICPARTPRRSRCIFFATTAEAEQAGFRACFRCRPELAPKLRPATSFSPIVREALVRIEEGFLDVHSLDDLANTLLTSSRHLRRLLENELGVSPVELAQTRRVAFATRLLRDTRLSMIDVAMGSGFGSVRRFNAAFRSRVGKSPGDFRKMHAGEKRPFANMATVRLRLDYRGPYCRDSIMRFLVDHATPRVEEATPDVYLRTVRLGEEDGLVRATFAPAREAMFVEIDAQLRRHVQVISTRVRELFDLDARPDIVEHHLRRDRFLRPFMLTRGIRIPGSFNVFETAIRIVLGQQVSVRGATTLAGRLVEQFGKPMPGSSFILFPSANELAAVSVERIAATGMPRARARTLSTLSQAFAAGAFSDHMSLSDEALLRNLLDVPGIGPWSAHFLAMRAFRRPDAFPAGDLALQKILGAKNAKAAERRAEAWRPWRSYAVMHLWNAFSKRKA